MSDLTEIIPSNKRRYDPFIRVRAVWNPSYFAVRWFLLKQLRKLAAVYFSPVSPSLGCGQSLRSSNFSAAEENRPKFDEWRVNPNWLSFEVFCCLFFLTVLSLLGEYNSSLQDPYHLHNPIFVNNTQSDATLLTSYQNTVHCLHLNNRDHHLQYKVYMNCDMSRKVMW